MKLFIDFESRSELDLTEVGAYRYAQHPSTQPLLLSWQFDNGPAQVTDLTQDTVPRQLRDHIERGGEVISHGPFDRILWNEKLPSPIGIYQHTDTMALALEIALPAKLEKLAKVLKVPTEKDPRGRKLINLFCAPDKKGNWRDASTHPEEWQQFIEYSRTDTVVLRQVYTRLPKMSERERRAWELDQEINERGVLIDVDAVNKLYGLSERIVDRLNDLCLRDSNGIVETIDKLPAMKEWCGVESITVETLPDLLTDASLTEAQRRVLFYRSLGAKASTKKLGAMLASMSDDNRVRGVLAFCGAHTRRWSGRLIQPQNFPRDCWNANEVDALLLLAEDYHAFVRHYPRPLDAISKALRGMIVPEPGSILLAADYNAIEVRVLCWLAGQEDILQLYRRGGDVYMEMARAIGGGATRFLGKVIVLGSGYMLGAETCQLNLAKQGIHVDLGTARRYIDAYRERFHRVKAFWYALRDAAIEAMLSPGELFRVGKISMRLEKTASKYLCVYLPNSMTLRYYDPTIEWVPAPWDDEETIRAIRFTDHQKHGFRETLSPGVLTNNIVQSTSREVMLEGMFNVDECGYPLVLTVHDEIIAECDTSDVDVKEFEAQLVAMPAWANGLPLKAEAKLFRRYGK